MLGKNEADKLSALFNESADKRQDTPKQTPFERYAETARLYIKDLRSADEAPPRLAMKIKELGLLWDDVEHKGCELDATQKEWKAMVDQEIALTMRQYGLRSRDVENARLFVTSTGRQTAKPVFKRRMD